MALRRSKPFLQEVSQLWFGQCRAFQRTTPVGILPIVLAGFDIRAMLKALPTA